MGTSSQMLAEARKHLGLGEPNFIQKWYRDHHGSDYSGNFAWCAALVTYSAHQSGNVPAVLPGGDRAYTVWFAQDFQRAGHWFPGTKANVDKAKAGDVVFFDWGGSDSIGAIDHVGVVERVLGDGRVQTIEGNTSDACLRRVRSYDVIAGYGRPAYSAPKPFVATASWPYKVSTVMRRGWSNSQGVKAVQKRLNALGASPKLAEDGDYGPRTESAVKAFQRAHKLKATGVIVKPDWAKLFEGK